MSKFGLTHVRDLNLLSDGRQINGEDLLIAISEKHKRAFNKALEASKLQGIPYQIKFHLHPDVEANMDLGGSAVSLALKSGEIWIFRHDGSAHLTIEPSVYLEKGRLQPRATKQIVLSHRAIEYGTRIQWSFAKAHDTAMAVRDVTREDPIVES